METSAVATSPWDVECLVDELLCSFPPTTVAPEVFWGAQYDAGLAWVDFPRGFGGLDLDASLQSLIDQRLAAAGAPRAEVRNLVGVQMVAPTVMAHGSPDQRERFLRRAFTCDEIWCQLFSEPGAGSDLASIAMRGKLHGDNWVLNGQKVWSTLAHLADWGLCLVRTDPTASKHAGLTLLAIDMHWPGIEIRPLRQISGQSEYNEVFFTDVCVSDRSRIGGPGEGWKVAMSTLTNERGVVGAMSRGRAMDLLLGRLHTAWHSAGDNEHMAVYRQRWIRLWTEAMTVRWTAERAETTRRRGGRPGPEASIAKVTFGELAQRVADLCVDLTGAAGTLIDDYANTLPTTFTHIGDDAERLAHPCKVLLESVALTIAGGTSEVNRNVLGERVLGLPGEPRPDREETWRRTP